MAEEGAAAQENPVSSSLGPLKEFLPDSPSALLSHIEDVSVLGSAFLSQLTTASEHLFSQDYAECISSCDVLLDRTWETLNTGRWKDVNINWRYTYTVLSVLKALSQCSLFNTSNIVDHAAIFKTCDMGLLMGAPILDNILARMSRKFKESLGDQRQNVKNDDDGDVSPRKKARASGDADSTLKDSNPTSSTSSQVEDSASKDSNPGTSCQVEVRASKDSNPGTSSQVEDSASKDSNPGTSSQAQESASKDSKPGTSSQKEKISLGVEVARCNCPSVEMFQATFYDLHYPVVITDTIGFWPALTSNKWSLEYLQRIAGERTVPVEIGSRYTEEDWTQRLMTVNEFIEEFITASKSETKGYLAQHNLFDQISELKDDIVVPVYCCLGKEEDVDINAWFGPSGTVSPLHHDPKHNFLCQVMGEKYVRLYAPEFTEHLYPHTTKLLENTSQVDCERPDLDKFPKFAEALYLECVLKPGDVLYIPPKHWHYVKSLSLSFSVSFWWQ